MEERQKILNACEGDSVDSKDHRDIGSHSTLNNILLLNYKFCCIKKEYFVLGSMTN